MHTRFHSNWYKSELFFFFAFLSVCLHLAYLIFPVEKYVIVISQKAQHQTHNADIIRLLHCSLLYGFNVYYTHVECKLYRQSVVDVRYGRCSRFVARWQHNPTLGTNITGRGEGANNSAIQYARPGRGS